VSRDLDRARARARSRQRGGAGRADIRVGADIECRHDWYAATNGTAWETGLLTRTSATVYARTTIFNIQYSGFIEAAT
jgi:hypothetical protein